jgi:hypothetical protein
MRERADIFDTQVFESTHMMETGGIEAAHSAGAYEENVDRAL